MLAALILFAQDAEDAVPEAAKGAGEQPGFPTWMIPFMLIMGAFYLLVIRPANVKEKKQREALFANLKKNDEVLTSSGIIGTVHNLRPEEDEVTIKIDENCKVRMKKSSIVQVLKVKEETPAAK